MSNGLQAHDLADRPVMGSPRRLPVVLLCHATVDWCGKKWIANTQLEFDDATVGRRVHEVFCETISSRRLNK